MLAILEEWNTEFDTLPAETGDVKTDVKNECNALRPWPTLMFWLTEYAPYK